MEHLANIIKKYQKNKKKNMIQTESFFSKKIASEWPLIIGDLSKQLAFEYLRSGCLYLSSPNPSWASEVLFYKDLILDRVNKKMNPKYPIMDIKVTTSFSKKTIKNNDQNKLFLNKTVTSLEQAVTLRNTRMIELGYKKCSCCATVWIKKGVCIFCKNGYSF